MVHELKCWPGPLSEIIAERKTHEVRVSDRAYGVGDYLYLRGWDPQRTDYTGPAALVLVTHLTRGGDFGLPPGLSVMSVRLLATNGRAGELRAVAG